MKKIVILIISLLFLNEIVYATLINDHVEQESVISSITGFDCQQPIATQPRQLARCGDVLWSSWRNYSDINQPNLYISKSLDEGITWTHYEMPIKSGRATMDCYGDNVYVLHQNWNCDGLYLAYSNDGLVFNQKLVHSYIHDGGCMEGLDVSVEGDKLYLFSNDGPDHAIIFKSEDNGATFVSNMIGVDNLEGGAYCSFPMIMFTHKDEILLVEYNSSDAIVTYKSTDGGTSFGNKNTAYSFMDISQRDSFFGVSDELDVYITAGDYASPKALNSICLMKSSDFGDTWDYPVCETFPNITKGTIDGTPSFDLNNNNIYQIMEYYVNGSDYIVYQLKFLKYNEIDGWSLIKDISEKAGYIDRYYMPHSSKYTNENFFEFIVSNNRNKTLEYIKLDTCDYLNSTLFLRVIKEQKFGQLRLNVNVTNIGNSKAYDIILNVVKDDLSPLDNGWIAIPPKKNIGDLEIGASKEMTFNIIEGDGKINVVVTAEGCNTNKIASNSIQIPISIITIILTFIVLALMTFGYLYKKNDQKRKFH